MSDSLRGMVPELEDEQVKNLEDAFVIASLEIHRGDNIDIFSGKVVGIGQEIEVTKLDIRLFNREAYALFKEMTLGSVSCDSLYLHLADEELKMTGPFRLTSPKIVDFDHQHKMCTLGIDLIKI